MKERKIFKLSDSHLLNHLIKKNNSDQDQAAKSYGKLAFSNELRDKIEYFRGETTSIFIIFYLNNNTRQQLIC